MRKEARQKHTEQLADVWVNVKTGEKIVIDDSKKTTIINLRDFPVELHRKVKAVAALQRISIKDFFISAAIDYLRKQSGITFKMD